MKQHFQRYRTSITVITRNGLISLDYYCNGFVLRNTSAIGTISWNDSQPIAAGQSISVGGNAGEIVADRISVKVPVGGSAELVQKIYIPDEEKYDS